ncbi:MAG: CopD family protein [Chloroflexi bacterium]|nr:CopD family protein [Chloroflexota bacterium]
MRSEPAADARLEQAPGRVTAWFSEPLEPGVSQLRVLVGGGERVDAGDVEFDPADETKMSVRLRDDVGPGFYLVTWETLSQVDGHFRFGSFEFTVLHPDGSEPTGLRPEATFDVTGAPTGVTEGALTKAAGLIGAAILVGGIAAVLVIALPAGANLPSEPSAKLRAAARRFLAWIILPTAVLLLAVGGFELWLQARQFGGFEEVSRVLETEWGERWAWRHALLGVTVGGLAGAIALYRRSDRGQSLLWLALAASLASLLLVSLVSHANAVAHGSFWSTASDFVHRTTAAVWIGGLVAVAALLVWARRGLSADERAMLLAKTLRRFSLLAATSLTPLLATGVFNALVQVSSWPDLVETPYGRALTVKLALIVPLLAVAALNAFVLRPAFRMKAAGDSAAAERLRSWLSRAVPLEAALAVAVLVVVGVLTQYTPSRTEAEAAAQTALTAAPTVMERDAYGFPLAVGGWSWVATGILAVTAVLSWIWAGYVRPALRVLRSAGRIAAVGLTVIGGLVVVSSLTTASQPPAFEAAVGFRYQASDGRLVLLEIEPFEVGANTFHVTVMTEDEEIVEADSVELRFSRLEQEGAVSEVAMRPGEGGRPSYLGEFALEETGWWAIEAVVDNQASASFYLRLDNPSLAPLEFAPPDYESDPKAEELFRQALERYESLSALKWREELTSGLLDPTGIGAWVITTGQAEAPDKIHYRVLSPGASDYQLVRAADRSCFQDKGEAWECRESGATESFDLDYMENSTAFRLGRKEMVDGEMTQVLLFNNPSQAGAWYAWWVGEETGYLRRQAMVAPGHFMLTRFFEHNQPVSIELPAAAASLGG